MSKLTRESLEFAKNHIRKFYDSDFFPKPFEFDALYANWDEVVTHLTCNEVSGYTVEQPRTFASIKPNRTFRVVHQLDPINTLIYTALAYLISDKIEKARFSIEEKVACSYRIEVDKKRGTFFANGSGYDLFIDKCEELSSEFPYVLNTDITDFYNQIYVHRLQNAIELADESLIEISKDIERFLIDLNGTVSQGVPVGPAASIIMSEAILVDVDNIIKEMGFDHTRYVDDFRVFGKSKIELRRFLARLTTYLYHNHRLTLAGDKTEIYDSPTFVSTFLEDPETLEKKSIHEALALIKSYRDAYATVSADVGEKEIRPTVLSDLFEEIVSKDKLDLGLARHILRRCRKYRIRAIAPALLNHFQFFLPVISDVILYLSHVTNASFVEANKGAIFKLLRKRYIIHFPFIKEWVEYYLCNNQHLLSCDEVKEFLKKYGSIRNQATAALNLKSTHWVRSQKGKLSEMSAWDRRSVIRASLVLSKKERESWLNSVEKSSSNFTELMTVKWLRSIK